MSDTYQHGPGYIISPQSPGERKKPHLIQMPPRTFSHRSSSHVITLTRNLGTHYWVLHRTPPIFAANGILFDCISFWKRTDNSKRFILTCTHNYVRGKSSWSGGWDSNPLTYKDGVYSPAPLSNSTAPRNIMPCLVYV